MKMNEWAFDELINMYEDALMEAQSLWLSNYCCSREEAEKRRLEDSENMKNFISICKSLKGE